MLPAHKTFGTLHTPALHHQPSYTPRHSPRDDDDTRWHDSSDTAKKDERSLDITQRIEKKLAEYNASENVFKKWLFEIISWCVSLICMASIVGIYAHLKDEPVSVSKSGLLLTLANVLGKIASAALIVPCTEAIGQLKWNWFHKSKAMWDFEIFDKASRGPWGAIMLLFRTRGRSLAALGALLIVLLLAIDTFFQQVVNLPERWSLEGAVGKLPVTIRYAPGTGIEYREGFPVATTDPDLFHVIEKFSYGNGTQPIPFGNGTRPDIPLSCPTSRCTWPVYETLGVCSQCADISEHLTYACLSSRLDWTANTDGGFRGKDTYPDATMCGYFLNATSEDPILMSGHLLDTNGTSIEEVLLMRTLPLTTLTTREALYGNGSIQFKHIRNTISDVLIVSAFNGTAETVYRKIPPVAQECVLSWCVKTLVSTYDHGVYVEEVRELHVNTTAGPFPWVAYPFVDDIRPGIDIFYLQDINNAGKTSGGHDFGGFGTANDTALRVLQSLSDIFPAFTLVNRTADDSLLRYRIWKNGAAFNRHLDFNPWLAPNNISRHMERLADAMTNVIRSAPSKTMIEGEAFSQETFISIAWAWLIFPFALLLFSLFFLVATILRTSKDGPMNVWKTSAMPTLIYGLPQDVQKALSMPESVGRTSRKQAGKVRIRLLPDRGWRVSGRISTCASPIVSRENGRPGWI